MVASFNPGVDNQFFHRDLLLHQPLLKQRYFPHRQRFGTVNADQARHFNHRGLVKIRDSAVVLYNQQHSFLGIKGDGAGEIDNKGGMRPGMEMRRFGAPPGDNVFRHIEYLFLSPGHHLIRARKVRVRVGYLVVGIKIVF